MAPPCYGLPHQRRHEIHLDIDMHDWIESHKTTYSAATLRVLEVLRHILCRIDIVPALNAAHVLSYITEVYVHIW